MEKTDSTPRFNDVGDAVMHFLGDTTQLDQAFNQVATQALLETFARGTPAISPCDGYVYSQGEMVEECGWYLVFKRNVEA